MSNAPDNWHEASIRDILADEFPGAWGDSPEDGRGNALALRSTNIDDEGNIEYRTGAERVLSNSKLESKRLQTGDLILEGSGGGRGKPVGRVAYFEQPDDNRSYVCSNFFRTLRPSSEVDDRFLFWRLLHYYRQPEIWRYQQQTTSIINLKHQDYLSATFKWPPLPEQRRIADVLDNVDAAIQETDNVVEKQEQVKTGLLQDLLTRGLDADGRLRDPEREPEAFRETEVGIVPETWNVETCAEVLSMSNGKSKTKKELEAETGDIPVWGGNGMTGYCSDPLFDQRGIVIGRVGEYCGSVHSTEGPSWITDNAIFATVESERVSLDYAALYLKWFDLSSKSTRTGQPLMTQTAVKEVPFLRPSLEEQERIVDRVQSLQDQQRSEKAYQDKLRQLKTALMQDLLTGRVRVPEAEARVDEVVA